MELGLTYLLLLCALGARAQGDFDLADALDDHEPTKKPGSKNNLPDLYPNLPSYPDPGNPDIGGNNYPRPKPRPRPPPGNSDYMGGGEDTSTYGSPQGNTVARIVSPIVSVVVVALVGAGVSYCKSSRRGNCMRGGHPETV